MTVVKGVILGSHVDREENGNASEMKRIKTMNWSRRMNAKLHGRRVGADQTKVHSRETPAADEAVALKGVTHTSPQKNLVYLRLYVDPEEAQTQKRECNVFPICDGPSQRACQRAS